MSLIGKKKMIVSTTPNEHDCPYCQASKSVSFVLYVRYVHVFGIPTYPYKKTVFSKCNNCKQVLNGNEMSPNLVAAYQKLKKKTMVPLYLYIGIPILAAIIYLLFFSKLIQLPEY